MRSLLDKELREALARRGLRERPWAVEVDESAYAFLVEKGFSSELGARPLRRSIERHLLAPLAAAIVEQTIPEGDQFLFVSAPGGEAITVRFVDPDADEQESEPSDVAETAELDILALARSGRGDAASVRLALAETRRIAAAVAALEPAKSGALAALGEPMFWETPGRFGVLAKAEYLDRLETATKTAERLAARDVGRRVAHDDALVPLVEVSGHLPRPGDGHRPEVDARGRLVAEDAEPEPVPERRGLELQLRPARHVAGEKRVDGARVARHGLDEGENARLQRRPRRLERLLQEVEVAVQRGAPSRLDQIFGDPRLDHQLGHDDGIQLPLETIACHVARRSEDLLEGTREDVTGDRSRRQERSVDVEEDEPVGLHHAASLIFSATDRKSFGSAVRQ